LDDQLSPAGSALAGLALTATFGCGMAFTELTAGFAWGKLSRLGAGGGALTCGRGGSTGSRGGSGGGTG
jgi:hypothetical protein